MVKDKKNDKGLIGAAAGGVIGAGVGSGIGVAGVASTATAAVTAGGTSAAAITTTVAAAGNGAGMAAGYGAIAASSAIPVVGWAVAGTAALGVAGYGIAKGIEKACENNPKTMGGKVWWTDIKNVDGWRLQKNKVSRHCRILDRNDVRQAYGSEEEMTKLFNSMPKR